MEEGGKLNIQFKKGVLELCVLSLLVNKDRYGYELVNEISEKISISEGTIYPLLRRLKTEGYVTTYLKESQSGPPRKYYKLTDTGTEMVSTLKEEWINFTKGVHELLNKEDDNE